MNIYNIIYEKVVPKSVNKSNTEGKKFMCICLFSCFMTCPIPLCWLYCDG